MRVSEKAYKVMPAELQALFLKCPNPGSDEVVGLFPDTKSGALNRERITAPNKTYGARPKRLEGKYAPNSGSAARFFYVAKASKRDRDEGCEGLGKKSGNPNLISSHTVIRGHPEKGKPVPSKNKPPLPVRNNHPCVKPISLMTYLCRLVTPPGGTVLDPFMGSGSTGKAAIREGFNFIGIERESEYLEIARARIEHEAEQSQGKFPL